MLNHVDHIGNNHAYIGSYIMHAATACRATFYRDSHGKSAAAAASVPRGSVRLALHYFPNLAPYNGQRIVREHIISAWPIRGEV